MKIVIPEQQKFESEFLGLVDNEEILASILWNRGYRTPEEVRAFLDPAYYRPTGPNSLPGIAEAVDILNQAIETGEKICIYGDYDVDGITATVLLMRTIYSLEYQQVSYHVPDRFKDGYGLSSEVIKRLFGDGYKILLTCDCGISNFEEVALAKDLGMTVIVTDHHTLPDQLPLADAIINPKMLNPDHPCRDLPGVGVAYMLSLALCSARKVSLDERLIQLVALGIVADVVPVIKENRYLLQKGLAVINSEDILPGLKALKKVCNLSEIDEEVIGFQLAPRLNAPGRITKPDICVELLLSEVIDEVMPLAAEIDAQNSRRCQLVNSVLEGIKKTDGPFVAFNECWHPGVIGIAAGRIAENSRVPAVLMTLKDDGSDIIVGSARSIEDINIFECLQKVSRHLDKFGGHAGAAGFSLQKSKLKMFTKELLAILDSHIQLTTTDSITVDAEIPFTLITLENYSTLRKMAPFGEKNPAPLFYSRDVTVENCRSIGDGQHQRLLLSQGGYVVAAVSWWSQDKINLKSRVDLVYTINANEYKGVVAVQLTLVHLRANGEMVRVFPKQRELEVVDLRGEKVVFPSGDDVCCYGEIRKEAETSFVNRYNIHKCDILVLTEIPPHLSVINEMVSVARCRRLLLGYPLEIPKIEPFLIRLMRLLKRIAHNGGITTLEYLASATGELEITVFLGMRVLRESGYLSWETTGMNIHISLQDGKRISTTSNSYKRMEKAEKETQAFRQHMVCAEPITIKRMLSQG